MKCWNPVNLGSIVGHPAIARCLSQNTSHLGIGWHLQTVMSWAHRHTEDGKDGLRYRRTRLF